MSPSESRVASSETSASLKLHAMRRRLTLLLASVTALGLIVLALFATVIDSNLRAEEEVTFRQGLASRLAAFVFTEDDGETWNVDGIVGDNAAAASDAVVVIDRQGQVLFATTEVSSFEELGAAGVADDAEVGVTGTITIDGSAELAAAAPFWNGDQTEGAVLVAATRPTEEHLLRNVVWIAAAGLTALSALGAWLVAGRVVRPMGEALNREERFLATAAHDIRTPMGRVRALSESALRTSQGLTASDDVARGLRDELRRLVSVATEASDAANDLLLAGRIDADQFALRTETLRLDELVASFEDSISNLAVDVDEPVSVAGDPLLLKQVIVNVLHNAAHHGQSRDGNSLIEVTVNNSDGFGVVVVMDNGPGLGGRNGEMLFERYAGGDTQRTGGGGGLGLWIVKSVITEHGGTVRATDRSPGPGTVIELRVPLSV